MCNPLAFQHSLLGSYADEFNRIEVEVLSVVAAQIACIMGAVKAAKRHFVFMDALIRCDPSVGLFITYNPSYAGEGRSVKFALSTMIGTKHSYD